MWWHRTLHDSRVELRMIAMLRKFLLFFVRILRQIFCCFGRKRTESNSHDDRLETINVIKSDSGREYNRNGTVSFMRQNWVELFNFHLSLLHTRIIQVVERDWNSWDDSPRTVSEHIQVYRENLVKPAEPEPVNEVEQLDLFAELQPQIVKQQKFYLNQGSGNNQDNSNFSRLTAGVDAEIPISVSSVDGLHHSIVEWYKFNYIKLLLCFFLFFL